MIGYLRACLGYFLFAGFFSLFINALFLTFPLYMLAVYDRVLASNSLPTLFTVKSMALMALVVLGTLDLCRSRLLVLAGIKLDRLLSRQVLNDMLRDLCRADSIRYTQGLKDINTLRTYLGGNSIFAFFDVPWIFIYLWVIYLVHPVLGATATAGAAVLFIAGLVQHRLTVKDIKTAGALNNQGRQWVLKSFRTAKELESMGMVAGAAAGFTRIHDRELELVERTGRMNQVLGAFTSSFGIFMQVVIYGAGAVLVLANEAGVGVIIAASIIMGRALAPVSQGIAAWKQTSGAKQAYDNLNRLFETAQKQGREDKDHLEGRLDIVNLSLDINETPVLSGIDFQLMPGEIMGLVGHNGAGKTCLCRLILGMWAPTGGRVELDGRDVCRLDRESLGRQLGYLPQSVELFAGTVKENIARMGAVDDEKVVEAAKTASAHDAILSFAQGYDTDIGEAGRSLSGGQRQRVGLARAVYGRPGLVILDEPNSNLDEQGEKALLDTLNSLRSAGTTTIMITHKPELLGAADKILMLEQGRQVRFGLRQEVFETSMGDLNATDH